MFDDNKVSRNWLLFFAFALVFIVSACVLLHVYDARRTKELLAAGLSPQAAYCTVNGFESDGRISPACVGVQK